jgi:hypothetical protein
MERSACSCPADNACRPLAIWECADFRVSCHPRTAQWDAPVPVWLKMQLLMLC